MRRSPLKRRTRLTRKKPMRTRPALKVERSRYQRRARDLPYMAWIRRQPCASRWMGGCHGRIEADHAGERSVGRKADDITCIPLCHIHHVQRGSFAGPFRSWDRAQMRQWLDASVHHYQRLYALEERAR